MVALRVEIELPFEHHDALCDLHDRHDRTIGHLGAREESVAPEKLAPPDDVHSPHLNAEASPQNHRLPVQYRPRLGPEDRSSVGRRVPESARRPR